MGLLNHEQLVVPDENCVVLKSSFRQLTINFLYFASMHDFDFVDDCMCMGVLTIILTFLARKRDRLF